MLFTKKALSKTIGGKENERRMILDWMITDGHGRLKEEAQ